LISKDEDALDPTAYYENRCNFVTQLRENPNYQVYPHKINVTHSVSQLISEYDAKCAEKGIFSGDVVTIAGRVINIRKQGPNLYFYDL